MGALLSNLVWIVVAMVILFVVLKLLKKSTKVIMSLLVNALIGAVVLWALSLVLPSVFQVNVISALIVGFLGIPGLILVAIIGLLL